jgi:ketosteroid isomerase-like protein
MMPTKQLIAQYYDSLNQKNNKWQELHSENAVFSDASQTLNARGRAAVIQSFVPFLMGVEKIMVKQLIVEGYSACAIVGYVYVNPRGNRMSQDVAEVWEVKNGELANLSIYFDLTAYRNSMRS